MIINGSEREFDVIGFGEIMLRLSPVGLERLSQCELLEKRPGGSELNVVSGVSLLGLRTGMVTKIPDNDMGRFIKNKIRFYGVSDDFLIYDSSENARIGIYYSESGAYPRKPSVMYDRAHSSINKVSIDDIDPEMFGKARVFHTSGISLALGAQTRETALELVRRFKAAGTSISFDVNYRANLWDEATARKIIYDILPYIDILFVSEETSRRMMQRTGTMEEIMRGYCDEFGCKIVASTQRRVKSPKCHSFNSTVYCRADDKIYTGRAFEDIDVIDRIGSGDAYVAGALFGLLKYNDVQQAVDFGNAMSAVKNTILGDMPASDFAEIKRVIDIHASGTAGDELNR